MAPSTSAKKSKKKGESNLESLRGLFKRLKSDNASANSTRASVSSGSGPHGPGPGNDVESTVYTASGGNSTLHQDPSAPFSSVIPPYSSSAPDLSPSDVGQGDGGDTSNTPTPTVQLASTDPQTQASDWKTTAKEGFGVASRFAQTLLKRVPECVDSNPVKVAFTIARVIIDTKDSVKGNKDELTHRLEVTANRLLAVKRTVEGGVPRAAEQAMEELTRILGEEMKKLEDLAKKSLAARIFDHEAYKSTIQQIFQRVNEATTSFQVEMAISIQNTASEIRDDVKTAALERLHPSAKADHKTVFEHQVLKREECTFGTRVKILDDIAKWANDSSSGSPRVFWLTGQAGSGKTTIAYTIAKLFEKDGNAGHHTVLGANFLCSRQFEETRERTRIVPTIAYQLARKCKSYGNALHIADQFGAVNHDISTQMKGLLVGPWQQAEAALATKLPLYLIVIDALDEIKDEGGSALLRELLTVLSENDVRGLKFLVTSRPNPQIVALCSSFASSAICRLQDVPVKEAMSDVQTYLKTVLPNLAERPELAQLGSRAGGLFIYAATVVKYLTKRRSITAREQTEMLEDLLARSYEPGSANDTTILIDELYRQIVHDAFSELKGKFLIRRLHILYTFLCTAERTSSSVVATLIADGDDEVAKV